MGRGVLLTKIQSKTSVPSLGILGWEAGNDDTLAQLESMIGNIAHPDTFDFPVLYRRVEGAYYETVVVRPSQTVCEKMVQAAKALEAEGVRAISTGCGFNALFQNALANAVTVPVFSSSLLQVPVVHRMLKKSQSIGIITADSPCLTEDHLEAVGITASIPVSIHGIEATDEFSRIRHDPSAALNVNKMRGEILSVVRNLLKNHPETGAIVLECTDLPPFASAIREMTALPVFDIVTLVYWVMDGLAGNRWPENTD